MEERHGKSIDQPLNLATGKVGSTGSQVSAALGIQPVPYVGLEFVLHA